MNTGLLRHAVATVLTVYGIETDRFRRISDTLSMLQQCLPFTVLKPTNTSDKSTTNKVATVLTVYGIETYGANPHSSPHSCNSAYRLRY